MLFKGKLNEKYPMLSDTIICQAVKADLWERTKRLLISGARKKDMSILEYIRYLKAYHKTHESHH